MNLCPRDLKHRLSIRTFDRDAITALLQLPPPNIGGLEENQRLPALEAYFGAAS